MGTRRKAWTLVLAAAWLGAGWPAHALDIDQIEVQSGLGEPLRAQIAVVSSDPVELANLQAQLASGATFARAGLARPQGVVADLRFAIAKDARGRTVIRITSTAPVREDFFTFLISLDWSGGHLVREYSVSLANPDTLSASAAPMIQAPVVAPSNAIVRAPETGPAPIPLVGQAPASLPATVPVPAALTPPAPAVVPIPVQGRPRERVADNAVPVKPAPATAPKPAPPPKAAPAAKPRTDPAQKPAPEPKPVAKTPPPAPPPPAADAKPTPTGGEQVKAGDTLTGIAARMDSAGHTRDQMMLALLRRNPDAFIGGNINRIRQGALLQAPDMAELSRFGAAEAAVMVRDQIAQWRGGQPTTPQPVALAGDAPRSQATNRPAPAARVPAQAPRTTGARLEIVPAAAAHAGTAGSRSGVGAGKGEMLRQEQQLREETLASRDVEIAELKKRIAGLEKLQQDQQKLIAMQSSELAAAQQRSGETQRREQAAAATDRAPVWPWLVGALAVLGALVWLVTRRRAPEPSGLFEGKAPVAAAPAPSSEPAPDLAAGFPTWHAGAEEERAETGTVSDGGKRLQLARAYLDLGDLSNARRVLRGVIAGDDAEARASAERMLLDIG